MPKKKREEKIIYCNYSPFNSFFDVWLAGITYPDPEYKINHMSGYLMKTRFHSFEYIISGKGHMEYNGRQYEINAGDFVFVHMDADAKYSSDRDDPYEKLWFNAWGSLIGDLANIYNMKGVVIKKVDVADIFLTIHKLLQKLNYDTRNEVLPDISIALFTLITRVCGNGILTLDDKETSVAGRIKLYIDHHLEKPLTLDFLKGRFFLSGTHIIRAFKEKYGTTPMKYLKKERLRESKRLLEENVLTVTQIAETFHFSSPQYFMNSFKSEFGITCGEYKAQNNII